MQLRPNLRAPYCPTNYKIVLAFSHFLFGRPCAVINQARCEWAYIALRLPVRSPHSLYSWENLTDISAHTRETKMIANALILTIALLLGYGFWLLDQLKFMTPYKGVLFHEYGSIILISIAVLFLNVFSAALALNRRFFLKDTGRKLAHLDKQFNVGQAEMPAPTNDEESD